MLTLYWKEIRGFFSSVTGYLVIAVFLTLNGLFLWAFPGEFNILENGYAGLDGLFMLAPFVFMFLIPAITMRLLSDEIRTGTIELLFTKPLSDWGIILAKYLAGCTLVFLSLLPTLVYVYSVYQLGATPGNLDTGGTAGSYIGLLFLGFSYTAIGVFASSLTDNQIIAFLAALFLCFIWYMGFESISTFSWLGSLDYYIQSIGISAHYSSMSRGVIDLRDMLYFLTLSAFFLSLTVLKLQSRKW